MSDDPTIWPACSECNAAYTHQRRVTFTSDGQLKHKWVWVQDCKHGRKGTPQPEAILMTESGPYELPEDDDGCPND